MVQWDECATRLVAIISDSLDITAQDEIKLCGDAACELLAEQPDVALELAHEKLHAWPFRDVPLCWRRLYEDASLHKAAQLLQSRTSSALTDDLVSAIVKVLDMGIALSGQPRRRELFDKVLGLLDEYNDDTPASLPAFVSTVQQQILSVSTVSRIPAPDFDVFQEHLQTAPSPLVISGLLDHWPALKLWQDPNYLLRRTIGGRRLVPVEIGSSYTDQDWTQKMMPFKDYLHEFVLPAEPREIGYLAQHDLLSQIPALLNDISTPDYCYTEPPPAPATLPQRPRQLDEPQLNAWFGPKGTRSPLHTDPYYNILCQVVGYKYVRLYAPEETSNLYARGTDESGVDMANTSQIDLSFARRDESIQDFPSALCVEYQEVILGPGECLFIPAGWWHFIESLSTSFSVSFWWN